MTTRLRRRAFAALLPALVLAAATGCSGGDSESSATTGAPGAESTAAPETTAAPAITEAPTTTAAPTTTVAAPTYAATIDELLAIGRPIVLAHTAGEDAYPASTLFGFGESVKAGVDMLDLNVQLTADGVLVVHHDDTVDRATNGTGLVSEMTYDELFALDDAYWFTADCVCTDQPEEAYLHRGVRTGEVAPPEGYTADDFAIPTLRMVIERWPDIPLNLEIKGEGDPARATADVLVAELRELGREKASVVASFQDDIVSYVHEIAPEIEVSPGLNVLTAWVLERTPVPDGMTILQLPPEYSGLEVITPELIADSTAAGYPIWVWPNDRALENLESYRAFLDSGIAGLNINFPVEAVQALTEYLAAG